MSVFGFRQSGVSWQLMELLEIASVIGLTLGVVAGFTVLALARRAEKRAETAIRTVSDEFSVVVDEQFARWGLTMAERDVAWFAVKGFSTSEIAELRSSSEGTIKSQSNAIYRKAGVSSRAQLVSTLVEDLLS